MKNKIPLLFVAFVSILLVFVSVYTNSVDLSPDDSLAGIANECGNNDSYKIISQNIPAKMNLDESFSSNIVIQNCSDENWNPSKYTLSVIDNGQSIIPVQTIKTDLTLSKFEIKTVNFLINAPVTKGVYTFELALNKNGVVIKPELSAFSIVVGDPTLCDLSYSNTKSTDSSNALQNCIDKASPGDIIAIRDGTYKLLNRVNINKPISLISYSQMNNHNRCLETNLNPCVRFIADNDYPTFNYSSPQEGALIKIGNGQNDRSQWLAGVSFRHIVVDGNRFYRTKAGNCSATSADLRLFNIFANVNKSNFMYGASIRAVCGSGFLLEGKDNIFAWNYIAENGINTVDKQWADGLSTVADNTKILDNIFKNNTDVDLIIWRGKDGTFANNEIIHDSSQHQAYAALMLNTYGSGDKNSAQYLADFTNSYTGYNKIKCGSFACGFGIQIGEGPWVSSGINIFGGLVEKNSIDGAVQGINIDGAGTVEKGKQVLLFSNKVTNSGGITFKCGDQNITTGKINLAAGSYPYFKEGINLSDTAYSWRCALPTCKNFGSLCKDVSRKNTNIIGRVLCKDDMGESIGMPNVSVQVRSGTDKKTFFVKTDANGDYNVNVGKYAYQSYSINVSLPSNQKAKNSAGKQTLPYSKMRRSGNSCSSWASQCLNPSCNASGGFEGCILDPGENKGPFIFTYSKCM